MAVHIGIGFKSRMKNTASKKKTCLGFLLIVFLAYVVCYLLSQTVFHEIYLFEWTAAHYYLCVWVASVTFCFLEMYKAALITTAGNWAGILIGQVLGDFIIKINATKITPASPSPPPAAPLRRTDTMMAKLERSPQPARMETVSRDALVQAALQEINQNCST